MAAFFTCRNRQCNYERAIADRARPFADILREIRAKAYAQNGEDTYAAYCWYGDPETALGPPPT